MIERRTPRLSTRERESRKELLWQRAGEAVALVLGLMSLGDFLGELFRAPRLRHVPMSAALGVATACFAAVALAPRLAAAPGDTAEGPIWRRAGRPAGFACAALTLLFGIAHWGGLLARLGLNHITTYTASCLLLLGASLLGKAHYPRLAVAADMVVGGLSLLFALAFALGVPSITGPKGPMPLPVAVALFLTAGAWMTLWPRHRPVAFFLESGSAAAVLRRLLPITLLYPVVIAVGAALRTHKHATAAAWANDVLVYGTLVFGVAVFWVIAVTLDRRDAFAEVAENRLRTSEEQVRTLLESTVEGIYAVGLDGRCNWCNPAAARLLGADAAEDLLGKPVHELIHHTRADGSPYPASECEMMLATQRGEMFEAEEEIVWRLDGTSFPADCKSSPLLRDGAVAGAVVTFSDVTERLQLRAQFHQSQKMEAIGRLAAGVAHDFNNLLTVINGYTEMLLTEHAPEPAASRAKVTSIRRAGERAAGLTKQLLAFSRQQVLELRSLDLNAVLAEMEPLLRRVIGEDIALRMLPKPRVGSVRADAGQIGQVLMNLVVNARDAMPGGGDITIETDNVSLDAQYAAQHPGVLVGDYVLLAVSDSGCGMDAETQRHIFEPFFTTKPVGQGTGLGLATVFGIVKQSGGSIELYSEPGRGTMFQVYLPRLEQPADEEPEEEPSNLVTMGRESVLLVEDEASVRGLMAEVLEEAGFRVMAVENARAALAWVRDRKYGPDLLISDLVMPEMDGRQLLRTLEAEGHAMRVLFISGYPDQEIADRGELEQRQAFLQKPFTPEALVRKVREVLEGHERGHRGGHHAAGA